MMDDNVLEPGWYPTKTGQRYWDGDKWLDVPAPPNMSGGNGAAADGNTVEPDVQDEPKYEEDVAAATSLDGFPIFSLLFALASAGIASAAGWFIIVVLGIDNHVADWTFIEAFMFPYETVFDFIRHIFGEMRSRRLEIACIESGGNWSPDGLYTDGRYKCWR